MAVGSDADDVADVEVLDPPERLLAQRIDAGVGLDRPGQVADVEEDGLAVAALADDATGDPVGKLGVLALAQRLGVVCLEDALDLDPVGKVAGKGVDPFLAQALRLGAALGLGRARGPLGHGTRPTVTRSPPM